METMMRKNKSWNWNEISSSRLCLCTEGWVEVWAGARGPLSLQTRMER